MGVKLKHRKYINELEECLDALETMAEEVKGVTTWEDHSNYEVEELTQRLKEEQTKSRKLRKRIKELEAKREAKPVEKVEAKPVITNRLDTVE